MCTFSFIISNALCFTYGFRFILIVNRDYFLKQHEPLDLRNGKMLCFDCGTLKS
jgi:hypothetical protein